MTSIGEEIEQVLEEVKKCRNLHIRIEELYLNAYIRVTQRYINHVMTETIDIGSVEVDQEHRNCGCFTQFLICVENIAKKWHRKVYVECVLNKILHQILQKRGYYRDDLGENYWN
jgi:hypothetical protein